LLELYCVLELRPSRRSLRQASGLNRGSQAMPRRTARTGTSSGMEAWRQRAAAWRQRAAACFRPRGAGTRRRTRMTMTIFERNRPNSQSRSLARTSARIRTRRTRSTSATRRTRSTRRSEDAGQELRAPGLEWSAKPWQAFPTRPIARSHRDHLHRAKGRRQPLHRCPRQPLHRPRR
jgi:hypothetical protein